jgi:hypothetical protein
MSCFGDSAFPSYHFPLSICNFQFPGGVGQPKDGGMGGENEFFTQKPALLCVSARLTAPVHHKNGVTNSPDSPAKDGWPIASIGLKRPALCCNARF